MARSWYQDDRLRIHDRQNSSSLIWFQRCNCKSQSRHSFVHPKLLTKRDIIKNQKYDIFKRAVCLNSTDFDIFIKSSVALRSLALTVGPALVSLSLKGSSLSSSEHLLKLCAHLESLRYFDLRGCNDIGDSVGRILTECCGNTLRSIQVCGSKKLSKETAYWISGRYSDVKCHRLLSINFSYCPRICDVSVNAIAHGFKNLRYLNLAYCANIRNTGIIAIAHKCRNIQSLNICCTYISDKAMIEICKFCSNLEHLNVSFCDKLTDASTCSLSNLIKLVTLALQGLLKITESTLHEIGLGCQHIANLNITGCQNLTRNGLLALIDGLGFIQESTSYFGFCPRRGIKSGSVVGKLRRKLREEVIFQDRNLWQSNILPKGSLCILTDENNKAAMTIQYAFERHKINIRHKSLRQCKLITSSVLTLQKYIRKWICYTQYRQLLSNRGVYLEAATLIQTAYRGHFTRLNDKVVWFALQRYRAKLLEERSCIIIQCVARRVFSCSVLNKLKNEKLNRYQRAILIQNFTRKYFITNMVRNMIVTRLNELLAWLEAIGVIHQHIQRKSLSQSIYMLQTAVKLTNLSATKIQSVLRRRKASKTLKELQYDMNLRRSAARRIQQVIRGSLVRKVRYKYIQSFVFRKREQEYKSSVFNVVQKFGDDDLSTSRNYCSAAFPCQIYWPMNNAYFGGNITEYCPDRRSWKVIYYDSDYEWIDLKEHATRVFLYCNGKWNECSLSLLPSSLRGTSPQREKSALNTI